MIAETTSKITLARSGASKRGFTLTEIAIVLGIIGVILGAIWVAAAAVYSNMRTSAGNRELLQIVQSVRALYATSATVDNNADMPIPATGLSGNNSTYVHAGVFPADALDTGVASTATGTVNPWNGTIAIQAAQSNAPNDAFSITFDSIPSNACINLLTASTGQGRDPGMFAAGGGKAGGTGTQNPITNTGLPASTAQANCDQGGAATAASFWFALRATN